MVFWILVGGLIAYAVILGIIGLIADRHYRAGWQRLLDDLEASHG